ncbi:hypothetical protein WKH57_25620 [Niallia taxi]|uniref:hypothetical protein n=1 Tax=Niallia taxi TaxID=2499688 RepID=UPI00316F6C21
MSINRERKRAILKTLIKQHGLSKAYDMFGDFIGNRKPMCASCGSAIYYYSEWQETGYEIKQCTNCGWMHQTFGLSDELVTKGFYYYGKVNESIFKAFKQQIEANAVERKRMRVLFLSKKKSQQKRKERGRE